MAKKSKMRRRRSAASISSEQEFLANYDASLYPHPSLSVDVALLTAEKGKLKALLLKRTQHPGRGKWALPGTFVGFKESLENAAQRALAEKTGVAGVFLEQLFTFGKPNRDPRTRVVTVAYFALVNSAKLRRYFASSEAAQMIELSIDWEGESGGAVSASDEDGNELSVAFDHAEILGIVVKRLRGKLDYAPIGFELLPSQFTLRQLQEIHETILGHSVNKDSFRRRLIASGTIKPTGKLEHSVGHRPAELYQFQRQRK